MAKKSEAKAAAAEPELVFGFDVSEFLRRVGVDTANLEGLTRSWVEAHPGQAVPMEVAMAFVKAELGEAQIAGAVRLVASGLVELVQTGRGPVQHSAGEVV